MKRISKKLRARPARFTLFALAEQLGVPDPDALGDALPGRLLSEWCAYWTVKAELLKAAIDRDTPHGPTR